MSWIDAIAVTFIVMAIMDIFKTSIVLTALSMIKFELSLIAISIVALFMTGFIEIKIN